MRAAAGPSTSDQYPAVRKYFRKSEISKNTKLIYDHYLGDFFSFLESNGKTYDNADDDDVLDYLEAHPTWSKSTRHNAVAAARSFYLFTFGSGHPILTVHAPLGKPGPQRTLTYDKLITLLGSINTMKPKGVRDLALITLMLD
ncbi:MAG: hypothetical protein EOM66_09510, partial [Clostridia bacterium]|nr:hypothetical protein [Clostridia bacterium]